MILTYIIIAYYWLRDPFTFSKPSYTSDPRTFIILSFFPIGLILTCSGAVIRNRYSEANLFLTKVGEPIHSGKPWYKAPESGLFLTYCGLVVSTDETSNVTAHAGYRIVSAKYATHRDCVVKEGNEVLDGFSKRRSW